MGGNKKKTINITSKHTNDNRISPLETIIETILQNSSMELPSVSRLNNNTDEIVVTENAVNDDDKVEGFNIENAVDDDDKAEGFNIENAVDAVDDDDTEDSLDDTPNTEVCYEMGKLNELPNDTPALSELDSIMLDKFDTLDTIHTEDEIENESDEPINNVNEYVEYNIPEDNYCELPALVVDYTKSATAGIRAIVCAGESIKEYQGVEVFIHNNKTYVRPFSSLSNSPFFGIAQHDANIGEDVAITTSGITKILVSKTINLPYLIRSGNQCVFAKNQKNGTIVTQITSVPININDILVGYGTNSDTLTGPNSAIHSVNKSNNTAGRFIVYKKILINQSQCKFVIDTMDITNIQMRKGLNTHGRTITVLDPMPKSNDLCIVMI